MRFVSDLTIKTQDKYMKFDQIQKYSHFKVKRLSICQKLFVLNYGGRQWPGGVLQLAQVISCEFCEISKNTFSTEHLPATASVLQGLIVAYQD